MELTNFGTVWRAVAVEQPDKTAIEQGDRSVSWGEFMDGAERLASWLHERGVRQEGKVALYLYNCPEFLIGFAGSLLSRTIPVNTNYRYGEEELAYLFENADAEALIFHGHFTSHVNAIRDQLPLLRHFLFVDDGTEPCPSWATPFEDALRAPLVDLPTLTNDDLLFLYTGGTTGMPKGVMWRQEDLYRLLVLATRRRAPSEDGEEIERLELTPGNAVLPACPLMHGTGLFTAITALSGGGRVVLLANRHFDAVEMATCIDERQVTTLTIVGDPFARPLLRALDADPGRFHLESLFAIVSSGAMFSEEIKRGLLKHRPSMLLVDAFSSSEALGMGSSISTGDASEKTARFVLGEHVRVVSEDLRDVVPGSDEIGRLFLGGAIPLGYYKDEEKTAATFPVLDGKRYSVPGDMAKVNADGSIQLLGRGSQCINTAGEKVFPEEVEETLKLHPAVADACVVGVDDDEYGQRIVAAVEFHPGATSDEPTLIAHVKEHLASYKAPRAVRTVPTIGRAVNGKMDYARHREEATAWMATRSG